MNNKNKIDNIKWFHSMQLGQYQTSGWQKTSSKLKSLHLPDELTGKTVLDVCAWDGFYSFECERRHAKRVLAVDDDRYSWNNAHHNFTGKRGFDLAKEILSSKVTSRIIRCENISKAELGTFDLILFLGVFYHVDDPLEFMRRLYEMTNWLLIVETHVDQRIKDIPAMIYYNGGHHGDVTNKWGPNILCVEKMLYDIGFAKVKRVYETANEEGRACLHAYK